MKISYDVEANAGYIYFTSIGAGEAVETVTYINMSVELDNDNQIIKLTLSEPDECKFENKLEYALLHPNIYFDELKKHLQIVFAEDTQPVKSIDWEANIDLNNKGQILGVEILFAEPMNDYGKLKHLEKYIAPFNNL